MRLSKKLKSEDFRKSILCIRKAFGMLLDYKKNVVIIFVCLIIIFLIGFFMPFITKMLIDDGIVEKNFKIILIMCSLSLLLYILQFITSMVKETRRLDIYNGIRYGLEKKSFIHLMKVKMDFFKDKNLASIFQTMKEDTTTISNIAENSTFEIVSCFLSAIGGGFALFLMEWRLSLLTLFFIPLNGLITGIMVNKTNPVIFSYLTKSKQFSEWYGDSINGMKVIRLFGIQKRKEDTINEKINELEDINRKQGMLRKVNEQLQEFLMKFFSILIYLVSGIILLKVDLTIGQIMAFETYAIMMTHPIIFGFGLFYAVAGIVPSMKRHMEFMEYPEEDSGESVGNCGDITFDNVSFAYDNSELIFSDMNFCIKQGSKVAVLGRNGVGKTTLLNLILRIAAPTDGAIKMSGEDIRNYDILSYRDLFGVVSQDVYLFNSGIKDNICLDRNISQKRLDNVIEMVNLKELVDERGIDYNVGENGSKISMGQKQKIALARAIIISKPFIILDEATSNLDVDTIETVTKLFDTELKNSTVICVTHTEQVARFFNNVINL